MKSAVIVLNDIIIIIVYPLQDFPIKHQPYYYCKNEKLPITFVTFSHNLHKTADCILIILPEVYCNILTPDYLESVRTPSLSSTKVTNSTYNCPSVGTGLANFGHWCSLGSSKIKDFFKWKILPHLSVEIFSSFNFYTSLLSFLLCSRKRNSVSLPSDWSA